TTVQPDGVPVDRGYGASAISPDVVGARGRDDQLVTDSPARRILYLARRAARGRSSRQASPRGLGGTLPVDGAVVHDPHTDVVRSDSVVTGITEIEVVLIEVLEDEPVLDVRIRGLHPELAPDLD